MWYEFIRKVVEEEGSIKLWIDQETGFESCRVETADHYIYFGIGIGIENAVMDVMEQMGVST